MKRFFIFLFSALMTCVLHAQIHVMPGMKMPEVQADWVNKLHEKADPAGLRKMEIVVFADLKSGDIHQTLLYVGSLESKYSRMKTPWSFHFSAVLANEKKEVESFLKLSSNIFPLKIGADINGRTFRNFVIAKVPEAVIGTDGAIAWIGPVMDLDYIIGAIIDGTFSPQIYKQVSQMKMEMQTALRSGLPDVAAKTAEKILEINPGDTVAIQTVLYSYELKNQSGKAIVFLEDQLKKCGNKVPGLRLFLLDRIIRSGKMDLWQKAVEEAVKQKISLNDKLNLAAFLTARSPRTYFPIKEVPALCQEILKDPSIQHDPEFYANALEITARAEYMLCRIDSACSYQEKAAAIRKEKNSPLLNRTVQSLKFYQNIKSLPESK